MSTTVDVAHVRAYSDNLTMLVQQKGSRLMPVVNVTKTNSKIHYFERLGAGEASEVFDRHGDTPEPANLVHTRRGAILRTFDLAEMIDDADKVRMLIDPTNPYMNNLSYALGRKADDVMLAALYGSANSYDSSEASSTTALSAGQIIDEDFSSANTDLTVAKLREARRILLANNADLDSETPILLHDGQALTSLLSETAVTSADFNTVKALVNGEIDTFMGFKFVHCERLANAQHETSEGFVRAIVFLPSALGVVTGRSIAVRVSERDDKRYSTQVYGSMDIGAVRIEEEKVVSIECYRA